MRIRQTGAFATAAWASALPLAPSWVRWQFGHIDDGAGGALQTLRRAVKFWWRCWWHAAPLRVSVETFRDERLGLVLESEPGLALRPLRSYLRRGLTGAERARAVRGHFSWLVEHLPAWVIERLYARPIVLVGAGGPCAESDPSAALPGLAITLGRAGHLGREGELALHLEWQGERVMSLAFSVLDAAIVLGRPGAAGRCAVIGSIQGVRGADERLRELGAAAQRLRPSALLVLGVQALSEAWGLDAPLAVAGASHVYAGYRSRRRRIGLDYDGIWQEAGGRPLGRHYCRLPARPLLRAPEEVESRRRAQQRRRNALREALFAGIATAAAALLASH